MDTHEAIEEAFDTLSLSDLQIYSDPSSCSSEEEQDPGFSFSSFRFKIIASPPPEDIVFFGKLISEPGNGMKPYHKPKKLSKMKTLLPEKDGDGCRGNSGGDDDGDLGKMAKLAPVVRPRRRAGREFLLFGLGRSPARMEMFDLRSRQTTTRIVSVNGGGTEEDMTLTARRKSKNWWGKLLGACIPIV